MRIYNTLSRKKEEFVPLEPGKVRIYACGPTVYNYIHIGNARPICVFDVLRRYLEYRGYEVKFVQNFTDIDDKLIKKAMGILSCWMTEILCVQSQSRREPVDKPGQNAYNKK